MIDFKFRFQILAVACVLILASCNKEGKVGDLTLNFQTKYQGNNISLDEGFMNSSGHEVEMSLIQFYLSDITLTKKNGDDVLVKDIDHVKIGPTGNGSIIASVPQDKYTSIKFNVGITTALNEADPADYSDPEHPLNVTQGTYWTWALMYKFATFQGRWDIEPDGTYDGTFAYHTGYEESLITVDPLEIDLSMEKGATETINLSIDVVKLLDNGSSSVDYLTEPTYHGDYSAVDRSVRLMTNLKDAISID